MAAITGELLATVHGASDLQDCEEWGEMDPYAIVSLTGNSGGSVALGLPDASGATAAGTRTAMKGGTAPLWEETLALPITHDPGELLVQVFNQNRAAPDDLVGYGKISIYDVLQRNGESVTEAVPLTAHPSGKACCAWRRHAVHAATRKAQGYVHLSLAFKPLPEADLAEAVAEAHMEAEPQLHAHDAEPLPELPGAEATADVAQQQPALSDLRPLPGSEHAYDRVHRPGYLVLGSAHAGAPGGDLSPAGA
ncbi:elicitor-responsive 1-like isoform X1 [Micractinium conductrix]|uniref:Elicitor-responsive 1-like isoform X1 n=1 Tax=Micractinium conductrix TaxID=554055 RepID=A0A2P6V2H7_9CHLO|nr:elicitor-responsive 1-like isoform X1 [Micractinium conductrix]|eukprot:PSC68297.1 elicitor-responsive 1-like isoform X1 [Micractinium conductrix]